MRIIGLIIAIVFATAAFFVAYTIAGDSDEQIIVERPQPAIQTVGVYVARSPIGLGDVVTFDKLEVKQWPANLMVPGFTIVGEGEQAPPVVGQVSRGVFLPGEPINLNKLSNPEDPSFIAANLPSGMRMVTISSDPVAGLAGFLHPGDRVDVMITQPFSLPTEVTQDFNVREVKATETIISNVRVLAVNQAATAHIPTPDGAPPPKRDILPASVSLEVTQSDAQRLRLAQDVGYISLSMRSLEDKDMFGEETVVTTRGDITSAQGVVDFMKGGAVDRDSVFLVRGTDKTEIEVTVNEEEAR